MPDTVRVRLHASLDVPAVLTQADIDEATSLLTAHVRWSLSERFRQQDRARRERADLSARVKGRAPVFSGAE